jgi:hypothetical protein
MIETNLKNKGYRQFPIHSFDTSHCYAKEFWQKKITNKIGTSFFLNLYRYDLGGVGLGLKWTANVQFTKGNETWDIDFQVPNDYTIEEVEDKLLEMWGFMAFEYYERKM